MSCEKACFEATVEACNDIKIKAGLTASTSYYWIIQVPGKSNIYQRLVITDADAVLTILKDDLPAGYLITGGNYRIQIRTGENYLVPVELSFGGLNYSCILASIGTIIREEDDESDINLIELAAPSE